MAPRALHLAVFAELNARIHAGEKRDEVLASAKVDPEYWEASQEFWLRRMADEASRGRLALTNKYTELYKVTLRRIAQAPPPPKVVKRVAPVNPNWVVVHAAPAVPPRPAPADGAAPQGATPVAPPPLVTSDRPPSSASRPSVGPASVAPPVSVAQPPPPSVAPPASVAPPPSMGAPPSVGRQSPAQNSHVARLSVEQLAAMRAELATSPEAEHPAVRGRFGLDDATWALEEAYWQRKLAVDQELFQRYLKRFQYCRSLLQRTT